MPSQKTSSAIAPLGEFPLGVDDYGDILLDEGTQARLSSLLDSSQVGLVSITPLICQGPSSCPFKVRCPIYQEHGTGGKYPLHRQCVVELNLARRKFVEYAQEFNIEDALKTSPTLRAQISKLAELDVYDYRTDLVLAGVAGESDGTLLIDQTIGFDKETHEEIKQKQEHPAWKIKDRIHRQRMEILDCLVATPRRKVWEKVSMKQATQDNVFQKQVQVLEQVNHLLEALDEK